MTAGARSGTAVVTLPTNTQILITRAFDAAKDLGYRAWTTPEPLKRWVSAKRGTVTTAGVDLRVGGQWRWVMKTDRGFDGAFHGEYRELVPNERIVHTEIFEDAPEAGAVVTLSFTETNGITTVTLLLEHANEADREMHIRAGMEAGMQDAQDHLWRVAVSLMGF